MQITTISQFTYKDYLCIFTILNATLQIIHDLKPHYILNQIDQKPIFGLISIQITKEFLII